jgi:hypothetical protein
MPAMVPSVIGSQSPTSVESAVIAVATNAPAAANANDSRRLARRTVTSTPSKPLNST